MTSAYRANLQALQHAQKSAQGTAAYGRLVNRPLGRRVAAAADLVGMTPNAATVISATMSGAAITLLALAEPSWAVAIGVTLLLAGGYVMDSVDGQLARLRGGGSLSGEWLDHTVDCFKTSTLHLAVLISFYRFQPIDHDAVLLVPIIYEVVEVVTYFGLIIMPFLRSKRPKPFSVPGASSSSEHPLRKWLLLPTDYGVLCWVFLLLALPVAFFTVYTALATINAIALVWGLRKWWRELRSLDAQPM